MPPVGDFTFDISYRDTGDTPVQRNCGFSVIDDSIVSRNVGGQLVITSTILGSAATAAKSTVLYDFTPSSVSADFTRTYASGGSTVTYPRAGAVPPCVITCKFADATVDPVEAYSAGNLNTFTYIRFSQNNPINRHLPEGSRWRRRILR
jgi:hypothetical protein